MQRRFNLDTVQEFWNERVLNEVADTVCSDMCEEFLNRLKDFLQTKASMHLSHSASSGLFDLLRAVRQKSKSKVLLCDFNCPKVADSVAAAGCDIELYDFDRNDGMTDWNRVGHLLKDEHAAIVVAHFFGVPTDFRPLVDQARALGVAVIEDCAHCLGGTIDGIVAGTIGDAAIFSFSYDKPLSLGGGGAVLVNNSEILSKLDVVNEPSPPEIEYHELMRFLSYLKQRRLDISRQVRPIRRALRKLPGGKRLTRLQPFEPASGIGKLRARLGIWQMDHYPSVLTKRNRNAEALASRLNARTWNVEPRVRPAWLKQKCFLPPPVDVKGLSVNLQSLGYRVGRFNWPRSLGNYLQRPQHRSIAEEVATRSVDCPIHQEVTIQQIEYMAKQLSLP